MRRIVVVMASAVAAFGCGAGPQVMGQGGQLHPTGHPEDDFALSLKRQAGQEELLNNLSGDDVYNAGRPQEMMWVAILGGADQTGWLMVFAHHVGAWPGIQPMTIVYADTEYKVLAWLTREEEPFFVTAHVCADGDRYLLRVFSRNRYGGGTHIDDYSVTESGIRRISARVDTSMELGRLVP